MKVHVCVIILASFELSSVDEGWKTFELVLFCRFKYLNIKVKEFLHGWTTSVKTELHGKSGWKPYIRLINNYKHKPGKRMQITKLEILWAHSYFPPWSLKLKPIILLANCFQPHWTNQRSVWLWFGTGLRFWYFAATWC